MRRHFAAFSAALLAVLAAPAELASASTPPPSGTVVHNPNGSYTFYAAANGAPAVLALSALVPARLKVGQLVSISADVTYLSGECQPPTSSAEPTPTFQFDQGNTGSDSDLIYVAVAGANEQPCPDGPTGNLLAAASGAHIFGTHQVTGGNVETFDELVRSGGRKALSVPELAVYPPVSGSLVVRLAHIAIRYAPLATSRVAVSLCRTTDTAKLARGADYLLHAYGRHAHVPTPAAGCAPGDTSLDPRGISVAATESTAAGGTLPSFRYAATPRHTLYPKPTVATGSTLHFAEGLNGSHSADVGVPRGGGFGARIRVYTRSNPARVSFTEVNRVSATPLTGAVFALLHPSCTGAPLTTTVTDSLGRGTFPRIGAGRYCLVQQSNQVGYFNAPRRLVRLDGTSVDLGQITAKPRQSTMTFAFSDATRGVPLPHVCGALYSSIVETVKGAVPHGRLTPNECDRDGDAEITFRLPVDVPAAMYVAGAPLGTQFALSPSAMAVPAEEWVAGITVDFDQGGQTKNLAGVGSLVVRFQRCPAPVASTVVHVGKPHAPGPRGSVTPGCRAGQARFALEPYAKPRANRTLTLRTSAATGYVVQHLPATNSPIYFPHGRHAFVDDLRTHASGARSLVGIGPEQQTVITVTDFYAVGGGSSSTPAPGGGGTSGSAPPTPGGGTSATTSRPRAPNAGPPSGATSTGATPSSGAASGPPPPTGPVPSGPVPTGASTSSASTSTAAGQSAAGVPASRAVSTSASAGSHDTQAEPANGNGAGSNATRWTVGAVLAGLIALTLLAVLAARRRASGGHS